MAKPKAETVQKSSDGWAFMHPTSREWTGQYKTRVEARAARAAVTKATGSADDSDNDSEAQTITAADVAEVSVDELVGSDSGAVKVVDTAADVHVDSLTSEKTSNEATSPVNAGDVAHSQEETKVMKVIQLTLDPKQRKSTSVVFKLPAGLRGSVRIAKTAFPGGVPPSTLDLGSDAENPFASAKSKLTPEQRKEARKNAPKLTAAQRLEKLQERAAKLQAKIAAEAAAPAATPAS